MSPELKAALKDWLDWVERGAPERGPYRRKFGLCTNLHMYEELIQVFHEQGLDEATPFGDDYAIRNISETQHECPKRLAWVRKQLEE